MTDLIIKKAEAGDRIESKLAFTPASDLEVKALGEELPQGTVAGWASTPDKDDIGHVVVAGAFDESIREKGLDGPKSIKFLVGHDFNKPAGVIKALETSGDRLWIVAQFNLDVSYARDMYEIAKMNNGLNFSVGFRIRDYAIVRNEDDEYEYLKIEKGDLFEVSAVTVPMNDEATMEFIKSGDDLRTPVVDDDQAYKTAAEFEKALVAKKFVSSRNEANMILKMLKGSPDLLQSLGGTLEVVPEKQEPNPVVEAIVSDMSANIAKMKALLKD